jgi:coproporphyrinogen III oxidase-like Fe-S oxidoreductase
MIERILSSVARRRNRSLFRLESTSSFRPSVPQRPTVLYVHVPFCEELCPYCSFHRLPFREEAARAYFECLRKEIVLYHRLGYRFTAVYVGGGTPTILIDELGRTVELVRSLFKIRELSIETNPNHLTEDRVEALLTMGTDRLSVGVQSFDDSTLKAVRRLHKYGSGREVAERLLAVKGRFNTLNVDMIFNFPFQTDSMLQHDLETLLSLGIDQVTYYPLMVSTLTIKEIEKSMGKMDYQKERIFYEAIRKALSPFYEQRTVWCFSRKHGLIDEYVVNFDDYVGVGSGSIGYVDGTTFANTFNVNRYMDMVKGGELPIVAKRTFSLRERLLYDLFMRLFGLRASLEDLEKKYGFPITARILPEILFFRLSGAIRRNGRELVLTQKGNYLVLVFMREFFTAVNNFRDFLRTNR